MAVHRPPPATTASATADRGQPERVDLGPCLPAGVASWDKTADGSGLTITYSCEQVDAILQGLGLEPGDTGWTPPPAAWFGAAQLDEAGHM